MQPRPEFPCMICETVGPVVLDHDHATGAARGWLCNKCNVMLGYAEDNPTRLRSAANYLERIGGGTLKTRPGRAAYMRDYRARRRLREQGTAPSVATDTERLTDEVARLNRELAARPLRVDAPVRQLGGSFGVSRPAPKTGHRQPR